MKNNLKVRNAELHKKRILKKMSRSDKMTLAEELTKVIQILNRDGYFLDSSNNNYIQFKGNSAILFDKVEYNENVVFAILNCENIVPIIKNAITNLHPIYYYKKKDCAWLSSSPVGGVVSYGKIEEYETTYTYENVLEEIDITTFNPYNYYKLNRFMKRMKRV